MKKTGKALIGVLSVAALVGTGVATWTINGGIVSKTTGPITPTIAEIGTRDIAIDVTAKDSTLVFDAVDDLKVIYNVKAKAGTGAATGFEPYGYDFKNIVPEYQPNLLITTQVLRNGSPIDESDPFFDFVEVPSDESETKISYVDWLNVELKDKGYDATLTFAWGAETGGLNPQEYVDKNSSIYNTPELQRGFFERVNAALDKITFTFTFKVGGMENTPVETPETGEVTIPTIDGSTLSIDGMNNGKVSAGTHTITITTEEGKVIENNKLIVVENGSEKEVSLTEGTLTRVVGRTYTRSYNFLEGATYSFKYNVVDEVIHVTQYTITFTQPENGNISLKNGEEEVTTGTKVDENTTLNLTVTASEGYHISSVLVNEVEAGSEYTTTFTKTIIADKDLTISAVMEKDVPVVTYTNLSDLMQIAYDGGDFSEVTVKGEIVALNTNGFVLHDGTGYIQFYKKNGYSENYKVGTIIEATGTPEVFNTYVERLQFNSLEESNIKILEGDEFKAELGEPIILNETINESEFDATSLRGKYLKVEVKPFKSGEFTNFKITGYDGSYTIAFNDSTFDDNVDLAKTYSIEALYSYTSSNRITLYVISMEEIVPTYDPVESVSITNTETELEVGKTLKLTSQVLPTTANQNIQYSIIEGEDKAQIEGDRITANAVGNVTIQVETVGLDVEGLTKKATKFITIKEKSSEEITYSPLTIDFSDVDSDEYSAIPGYNNDGTFNKAISASDGSFVDVTFEISGYKNEGLQFNKGKKSHFKNTTKLPAAISSIEFTGIKSGLDDDALIGVSESETITNMVPLTENTDNQSATFNVDINNAFYFNLEHSNDGNSFVITKVVINFK